MIEPVSDTIYLCRLEGWRSYPATVIAAKARRDYLWAHAMICPTEKDATQWKYHRKDTYCLKE